MFQITVEVLDLDKRRARAFVEADWSFLEYITAANCTHVESSGLFRTKTELMAFLLSGEVRFVNFTVETNEALAVGDAVILTGTYTNQVETRAGLQPVKSARHLRVYARTNGFWQVVAHQATEIVPSDPGLLGLPGLRSDNA